MLQNINDQNQGGGSRKPTPEQWAWHRHFIRLLWRLREIPQELLRIITAYFIRLPLGILGPVWNYMGMRTDWLVPVEQWAGNEYGNFTLEMLVAFDQKKARNKFWRPSTAFSEIVDYRGRYQEEVLGDKEAILSKIHEAIRRGNEDELEDLRANLTGCMDSLDIIDKVVEDKLWHFTNTVEEWYKWDARGDPLPDDFWVDA